MKPFIPFILATLISSPAMADEPAKSNCALPTIPIPQASDLVNKYYHKHVKEYNACIAKFIDEQEAISKNSPDVVKANAAHDAADAAIKEHNQFIEDANAREAQNGEPDDDATPKDTRKAM